MAGAGRPSTPYNADISERRGWRPFGRHDGKTTAVRLNLPAVCYIGETPILAGSRPVADLSGVRSYHLRSARRLVPAGHRGGEPRHLVMIYRVAENGVVEVLSLVHDRQRLDQAARRAHREADG